MNKCPNCGATSETEVKCVTCDVDMVKAEEAAEETAETKEEVSATPAEEAAA